MEQIKRKDNAEMVVLRVRSSNNKGQQGRNKNLNQKASRPKIEQMGPKESLCGSAAGLNLLVWLKGLALDPFEPEASNVLVQKFQHQTLELREVWRSGTAKYPSVSSELNTFTFYHLIMLVAGNLVLRPKVSPCIVVVAPMLIAELDHILCKG